LKFWYEQEEVQHAKSLLNQVPGSAVDMIVAQGCLFLKVLLDKIKISSANCIRKVNMKMPIFYKMHMNL